MTRLADPIGDGDGGLGNLKSQRQLLLHRSAAPWHQSLLRRGRRSAIAIGEQDPKPGQAKGPRSGQEQQRLQSQQEQA